MKEKLKNLKKDWIIGIIYFLLFDLLNVFVAMSFMGEMTKKLSFGSVFLFSTAILLLVCLIGYFASKFAAWANL